MMNKICNLDEQTVRSKTFHWEVSQNEYVVFFF